MQRLLQGEVGSGKTVVALRAMLAAVDSGGQAALLAPTEVLAAQHHRTITAMLGDLAEGGMLGGARRRDPGRAAHRQPADRGAPQGAARHRLRRRGHRRRDPRAHPGAVDFHDLALVVVDEQHRFGVEQRDALRGKGATPPHLLVMTATPIPRTVAMTVFGDLETSTLRELPGRPGADHDPRRAPRPARLGAAHLGAGGRGGALRTPGLRRLPADRRRRRAGRRDDASVRGAGRRGGGRRRARCRRRPPPSGRMASVYAVHAALLDNPALAGLAIEVLHGRMAPEDKDAVMRRFQDGEVDVLVSTTVIEVGVDVGNASVMVDHGRRPVRGVPAAPAARPGRAGGPPGLCLLVTGSDAEPALGSGSTRSPPAPTGSSWPGSTSRSGARATSSVPPRAAGAASCSSSTSSSTRTSSRRPARTPSPSSPRTPSCPGTPTSRPRSPQRLDAEQAAYLERG